MIGSLTSHTTSDKSVLGWKKLMKEEPSRAAAELDLIIKNTYRIVKLFDQFNNEDNSLDDFINPIEFTCKHTDNIQLTIQKSAFTILHF